MAKRKRGLFGKILVVVVLVLAAVGAYTVYDKFHGDVENAADEVAERAERVKEALK